MAVGKYVLLKIDYEFIGRIDAQDTGNLDLITRTQTPIGIDIDYIQSRPALPPFLGGEEIFVDSSTDEISIEQNALGGSAVTGDYPVWRVPYVGLGPEIDQNNFQQ